MTEQWRILVVEDEEQLNQSIVNSLRKDGYLIQGVRSGAEAIRMLWSEEFDVVIGDLKTPGADGFELLQWLRTFRPRTRMIMVAAASPNSSDIRTHALEAGVVSYLEKPLNLHLLKEELRRLLQQTGFSANLDSFDLLDVIQIVTMSRKSIALLVNTGLEERGTLRFQGGELIWAEYGILHGEEAFFALAAYKNGTVIYQPWDERIIPNVKQPLSRLIFQALQYRAKYAVMQQVTGEQAAIAIPREPQLVAAHAATMPPYDYEVDDSPMLVLAEESGPAKVMFDKVPEQSAQPGELLASKQLEQSEVAAQPVQPDQTESYTNGPSKEWWQQTGKRPGIHNNDGTANGRKFPGPVAETPVLYPHHAFAQTTHTSVPVNGDSEVLNTPREDLPSWLTEQPTQADGSNLRPSALSTTAQIPVTPSVKPHPASEWRTPKKPSMSGTKQTTQPIGRTTEPFAKSATSPSDAVATGKIRRTASPEWQPPEPTQQTEPTQQISPVPSRPTSEPLQSLTLARKKSGDLSYDERLHSGKNLPVADRSQFTASAPGVQQTAKRNYPALVAALQTLGYSISGFIAAAVVSMDGQPIAQVAIDDLDISQLCKPFGIMLQGALQALEQQQWGNYERMVITSADRHILLNIIGDAQDAFQVLITTREADPAESLEVLQNVEGAIGAALK
ncbi:MAG TPA: response regulator [Ktedonobacteraceae bacterium]|nr:response regulator [Ktedonobacteraceae bacterium]